MNRVAPPALVVRGDVHVIALPDRRGHAHYGRRSTSTPSASFDPEIEIEIDDQATRVMCEMVGAVDARALGKHVGHLTLDEMCAVDDAFELVLDLA